VTPLGHSLMAPPPPRPLPHVCLRRWGGPQHLPEQPAYFGERHRHKSPRWRLKVRRLSVTAAQGGKKRVSAARVCARTTARKAWASRARVMWRYQPCHERTS